MSFSRDRYSTFEVWIPRSCCLARLSWALRHFALRYGPYPWDTFSTAITPDLSGGIEFPTHVMQGPGSSGRTTPHEVAHQWFYALVGNNQGRDPFLDEGVASFAEGRFESTLDDFGATSIPSGGVNQAGQPMAFWESHLPDYYRSVYVQGASALAALGNPDLIDCALRLYIADHAYQIATQADLVDSLTQVFPEAATVLSRYGIG